MPSKRRLLILSILLLASSSAVSQTAVSVQDKDQESGSKKAKLEIELPAVNPGVEIPLTPEAVVASVVADLKLYPRSEAHDAMERLVLSGEGVIEPLRHISNGRDFKARVAASVVLGELGDAKSVGTIERLLGDSRSEHFADELYIALEQLDGQRAVEFATLASRGSDGRQSAAGMRYLRRRAAPDIAPILLSLLDCRRSRVRVQTFEMLQQLDGVDLVEASFKALGDGDAGVCELASHYLIGHRNEAITQRLVELADEDPSSRQSSWALLTLAELAARHNEVHLTDEQAPLLEGRLNSHDPLTRLASAYGLIEIGLRSERPDAEQLLVERILPAIMETFLQNTYFKDFRPLFEMAHPRIQRITGSQIGRDLSDWRNAWLGEGGVALVRRDLPPDRLVELAPELIVRFQRHGLGLGGRDQSIALVGEAGLRDAADLGDKAYFLDDQTMTELVETIVAEGMIDRPDRRLFGGLGDGYRLVRIRWSNRERTVLAREPDDPEFDRVEQKLLTITERQLWQQLYLGQRADFVGFYELEKKRFGRGQSDEEWDAAYLHLLQVSLQTLKPDARVEALAVALNRPGLVSSIGAPQLTNLLAGLEVEDEPEGSVAILVELAIRSGKPELREPLFSFLTRRYQDDADRLLKRLLTDRVAIADAATDSRPQIRRLAMEVIGERRDADSSLLLRGAGDSDPRVRRAAILSMGLVSDPAIQGRLMSYARGEVPALRNVALEGVGATGSPEALQLLVAAANEETGTSRRSAMFGLAAMGGAQATIKLREIAELDASSVEDRIAAVSALGRGGDAFAVEELVRLSKSPMSQVREEAACQLASLGDMRGVPVLLEMLTAAGRSSRALDFLSVLLSTSGGEQGDEFAGKYRSASYLTQIDWFRRALEVDGYPQGGDQIQGISLAAVMTVLKEGRWYLRFNAATVLEREFGVKFGTPYRFATQEEVAKIAARWESYLNTRSIREN